MGVTELEAKLGPVLDRALGAGAELISLERLTGGASQETYRLEARHAGAPLTLALRRAAGGIDRSGAGTSCGLLTEARLMKTAGEVGIPEPEVLAVLEPEDGLGPGFLMEWLEGETLGARIVRSEELREVRPRLAYQCGDILARIHAIDLDDSGLRPLLPVMSPREYVEETWDRYKQLPTAQPMIDFAGRFLLDHLPSNPQMTLVHNDFRNGNLMIDPSGVVAVLDWELAHIGDPMRDLGWICTNSWRFGKSDPVGGFGSYEDLFAGYESISGRAVDREHVRFWEVFGSFWWAIGCLGMGQQYRVGPDRSVERLAIGRRSTECQIDCVNLLIPGEIEQQQQIEEIVAAARKFSRSAPEITPKRGEMAEPEELVASVTEFLRTESMAQTTGRLNFLSRVAANSLDVVSRELEHGAQFRQLEQQSLQSLLPQSPSASLVELRERLCQALRTGTPKLDEAELAVHLRNTVARQTALDQPKYSGLATALKTG